MIKDPFDHLMGERFGNSLCPNFKKGFAQHPHDAHPCQFTGATSTMDTLWVFTERHLQTRVLSKNHIIDESSVRLDDTRDTTDDVHATRHDLNGRDPVFDGFLKAFIQRIHAINGT